MPGFQYNAGVEQQILNSSAMTALLGRKAQHVGEIAIATAPVGSGPAHDKRVQEGTDYKSNIGAGVIRYRNGPAGVAYAEAPHSVYIEFGTYQMEAFATLRNALEGGAGS